MKQWVTSIYDNILAETFCNVCYTDQGIAFCTNLKSHYS